MLSSRQRLRAITQVALISAVVFSPILLSAQVSPWERAALNLETSFTGPLARSLALVAIVVRA